MGSNDWHMGADGRMYQGDLEPPLEELRFQRAELDAVIEEMRTLDLDEHTLGEFEQTRAGMTERISTLRSNANMLKGTGFIIIDPAAPRLDSDEITDRTEAEQIASNLAYQSRAGYAIIYAPILVMRPKRETAISSPSKLLEQMADLTARPRLGGSPAPATAPHDGTPSEG